MTLRNDINTLIETSLAVTEGRRTGHYTKDDGKTVDAMARSIYDSVKVRDAIKRGKRGVALLFDDEGKMQVVNLGESDISVRSATKQEAELGWLESYEQNSGEKLERTKAESHKRSNETAGKFPPQISASASASTGDAAAADARRRQMTADAKRFNQEAYAHNERIAQAGKAASDIIWKKPAARGR